VLRSGALPLIKGVRTKGPSRSQGCQDQGASTDQWCTTKGSTTGQGSYRPGGPTQVRGDTNMGSSTGKNCYHNGVFHSSGVLRPGRSSTGQECYEMGVSHWSGVLLPKDLRQAWGVRTNGSSTGHGCNISQVRGFRTYSTLIEMLGEFFLIYDEGRRCKVIYDENIIPHI
jgi:hypothetical protein